MRHLKPQRLMTGQQLTIFITSEVFLLEQAQRVNVSKNDFWKFNCALLQSFLVYSNWLCLIKNCALTILESIEICISGLVIIRKKNVVTFSNCPLQSQNRSFQLDDRTRTTVKCTKKKIPRAKRLKFLFTIVICKFGSILGVITCQSHRWRRTKKTKEPRDHYTITQPQYELTKQRKNIKVSYNEVNPKFVMLLPLSWLLKLRNRELNSLSVAVPSSRGEGKTTRSLGVKK